MAKRNVLIGAMFVLVLGALGVTQVVLQQVVEVGGGYFHGVFLHSKNSVILGRPEVEPGIQT